MATGVVETGEFVNPDGDFVKEIINLGGEAVKKCFQCATCSVICPLSPDDRPFPRKEMIWAQWGLKDRLLKDPDIWLCHQCSDCTEYCPRNGRPGDVMAAVRSYAIMQLAVPGFFARAFARPQWLPLILGVAILLLFGFLALIGGMTFPTGEVVFHRFIPATAMEIAGSIVMAFAFVVAGIGILRLWRNLGEFEAISLTRKRVVSGEAEQIPSGERGFWAGAIPALVRILTHSNFNECGVDRIRYFAHLAMLYGFILLFAATTGRALYHFLAGMDDAPGMGDPVKVSGNLGALLLTVGVTLVIYNRLFKKSEAGRGTYFDWFFILVLYFAALSGVFTQVARLAQLGVVAYWIYLSHLFFVFILLAYAPYSKFAHFFYRALVMMRAKRMGREKALGEKGLGNKEQPTLALER